MSAAARPPGEPSSTSTEAVHAGTPHHRPHNTLAPGIAQTATFTFRDTADLERYMRGQDPDLDREEYGRYGNPTVRELETRVAALEGADDALAFASGMAAVTSTLFALTKAGDHVVLFNDCYRRTRQFVVQTLARFGVEHTMVAPGDLSGLSSALRPNTRCVITESPTNPYLHCVDLEQIAEIVRRHGRVRTLVDSTFATPVNCRPLRFGIDLVVHSATKYLAGHNDVLGGIVAGPQHIISLLREARGVLGGVLDPHAAFLIARGLKTLNLRVERQNRTAHAVALELERHPQVKQVFYPALESHSSHAVARAQMRGFGGVVSFIVEGGRAAAAQVVDGCRLAKIAPSLGGVETLIEQPCLMSFSELSDEDLKRVGIDPALIRLSVGIEDTSDIVEDVMRSLAQLSLPEAAAR
ncbi:MAG TPA: aminotransferase class I/II-fold pyridoxal phosphate-dependent enzyme [Polyangiaceae bacterium]|nr:aminotransferase class I/II-fold pyridoxal phosphate-dependent enzyme [Polyangiaceae bacterium]